MKYIKKIIVLVIVFIPLISNAQHHRIEPMFDIYWKNYDEEVITLLTKMERISLIEKMEGISLNNELFATYDGEIILKKEQNTINITINKLNKLLESNKHYIDINTIRTELFIQTVEMFKYINEKLSGNKNIKNIYIKTNMKSGGAYISIEYYVL